MTSGQETEWVYSYNLEPAEPEGTQNNTHSFMHILFQWKLFQVNLGETVAALILLFQLFLNSTSFWDRSTLTMIHSKKSSPGIPSN